MDLRRSLNLTRGYCSQHLKELNICRIDDNILRHLFYHCPNLTKLTIGRRSSKYQLVDDFSFLPTALQTLDLTCGIRQVVAEVPYSILQKHPLNYLQVLILRKASIPANFCRRLTKSENLSKIELERCTINGKAIENLAKHAPQLEIISFRSCRPRKQIEQIVETFSEKFQRLRIITICGWYERGLPMRVDMNAFLSKLGLLNNVKVVNISYVESETRVEEYAWRGFEKLERLKVSSSDWITDTVLLHVVRRVKTLTDLKVIRARNVDGTGLVYVNCHPNLKYVLLYRCGVTDEKIEELKRNFRFKLTDCPF